MPEKVIHVEAHCPLDFFGYSCMQLKFSQSPRTISQMLEETEHTIVSVHDHGFATQILDTSGKRRSSVDRMLPLRPRVAVSTYELTFKEGGRG